MLAEKSNFRYIRTLRFEKGNVAYIRTLKAKNGIDY
jgi:hypothetical protein